MSREGQQRVAHSASGSDQTAAIAAVVIRDSSSESRSSDEIGSWPWEAGKGRRPHLQSLSRERVGARVDKCLAEPQAVERWRGQGGGAEWIGGVGAWDGTDRARDPHIWRGAAELAADRLDADSERGLHLDR